jgi:nitrite reductase/ring-hydroxylating ferredoxin subunit
MRGNDAPPCGCVWPMIHVRRQGIRATGMGMDGQWTAEIEVGDIPDGGALEVLLNPAERDSSVIVLRRDDQVYAYRNLCPHAGRFLNWAPGRFLFDQGRLVCAAHGAAFEVADGLCVDGPCRGSSLVPVPVSAIDSGRIRIGP